MIASFKECRSIGIRVKEEASSLQEIDCSGIIFNVATIESNQFFPVMNLIQRSFFI